MGKLFSTRNDGIKLFDAGTGDVVIGDITQFTASGIGNGNYLFDPKTGRTWSSDGSSFSEQTPSNLPADPNVEGAILRWDDTGNQWVSETDLTVSSTGNLATSGTITSTNTTASTNKDTGAIVTEGGLGVEGNINAGGNIAAGGTVSANGTGASNISGTLGVGTSSSTTGVITLRNATNSNTVTIAGTSVSDVATLSSGFGYLIVADNDATYDANDNYAASAGYVRQKVSDVVTSIEWKGFAKVISGTGNVTGGTSFNLSTASSPVSIPGGGTQYFDDDDLPQQLNVVQSNFPSGSIVVVETGSVHRVWKSNGTQFVLQSAPVDADTYGVLNDFIQTTDSTETAAIYRYVSVTPAFTKIGEFRVGQIENGTTSNTIAVWNNSAQAWREFSELLVTDEITPMNIKQIEATASHALVMKSTSGVGLTTGNVSTDNLILAGGSVSDSVSMYGKESGKRVYIASQGAYLGDGIVIGQATVAGDIRLLNTTTGNIVLQASVNKSILSAEPSDADTSAATQAISTVAYTRKNIIQRKVDTAVANTGTAALTVDASAAKFYVKVKGNTTESDAYASEIMAIVDSGSTVDATEYAVVGNASLASIAIARVSATSMSCTVTNNTGEVATVAIHAIPIR